MKHGASCIEAPAVSRKAANEHLRTARMLVWEAVNEICQSGMTMPLARELNELRALEDKLWQLTTADRR